MFFVFSECDVFEEGENSEKVVFLEKCINQKKGRKLENVKVFLIEC